MANAIKDFFAKKKLDAKFKIAGGGHKLSASTSGGSSSVSSQSKQLNTNKNTPNKSDSSTRKAAEAAIDRIQRQQNSSQNKTNTLDNILIEERKRITEEYKEKQKIETMASEELKEDKRYKEFESKQLFSCPTIESNESKAIHELMKQIEDYIEINFVEDLTLMSVMTIINCNFSIDYEYKQRIKECVSILDKIVTNLLMSSPEDREKFKKIRKSKIEKKVLQMKGGLEFLISIGFEFNENEEWIVFNGNEEDICEQMNYYKDVLNNVHEFPIILDRQQCVVESDSKQIDQNLSQDFFRLSAKEVTNEMKNLTQKRELEETLRTKKMREQKPKTPDSRFSRLRFKFPNGVVIEATFSSRETLSDVKNWLTQHLDSLQFNLKCGPNVLSDEHLMKSIQELSLVPTAALIIIEK